MATTISDKTNGPNEIEQRISKWNSSGLFIFSSGTVMDAMIINHPFRADAFAFILVMKGEFHLQHNFTTYRLSANSLFFAVPGAMYEVLYISTDVSFVGLSFQQHYLEKHNIHFTSSEIIYFLSDNVQPHSVLPEDECNDLCNAIVALGNKIKLSPQSNFYNETIHHSFLGIMYHSAMIHSRINNINSIKLNRKEELASSFLKLLSENFKKERSVQFYADALFITARHLTQVVKDVTGKTAGELIDDAVIKEAKVLLTTPVMNVALVAETLEFSNQSFFGKYFKNHTGTSPSDYRANSRISHNPPF